MTTLTTSKSIAGAVKPRIRIVGEVSKFAGRPVHEVMAHGAIGNRPVTIRVAVTKRSNGIFTYQGSVVDSTMSILNRHGLAPYGKMKDLMHALSNRA